MLSQSLSDLFQRDLPKVNQELISYSKEELIWKVAPGTNNSAGNLSLHIAGNLQHFFGAVMGNSDYKRDREFEFNGKVSREELIAENTAALRAVVAVLDGMSDDQLKKKYPEPPINSEMTTEFFYLHLYSHMLYHLGQINYHRRMLDKF